jgi:VWFA-related protein
VTWQAIQLLAIATASMMSSPATSPAAAVASSAAARIVVDVAVLSATGEPVKGLSAADFEIYSNGRPVPIASCEPGSPRLNVVLLVDASASMRWQMRDEDVKEDVKEGFVPAVKPNERARIGSIGGQNYLSPAFTSNPQELKRAADRALDDYKNFRSPSPIWDAVYSAIDALSDADGRRAILLLSDGRATANRRSVQEVGEYAARFGVLVNIGGEDSEQYIRQSRTEAVVVRAGVGMKWINDLTGGFQMREKGTFREFLVGTLEQLRSMYTLSFDAPILDGDFHALEVRVKRADGSIRARQVYKAPER